jgi:PucR C-terminal helix-turn-helix domain/GGDEF-like domain
MTACSPADVAAIERLARAFDHEVLSEIAGEMAEAMSEGLAQVRSDQEVSAALLAASRETARLFVSSLEQDPWTPPPPPPALGELARVLARRGSELTVLVAATRYGQAVFWPAVMRAVEQTIDPPAARMRMLGIVFDRFGRYLEAELEQAVAVFQAERDLRMRGADLRRRATIEAVIRGDELNVDSASRALGYELRWLHTGLVLWSSAPGPDGLDVLESFARRIATRLGTRRLLMTPSGSGEVSAWLATDRPPEPGELAGIEIAPEVCVAIGRPAPGIAGFRRTHDEAQAARAVALRTEPARPITCYADIEIVSLLTRDQRGADALVARELAGLSGTDANSAKLRRTALAFIQCAGSATAAGRKLGVHTNTVRYRVEQAERRLGRKLVDDGLPLQLALMLSEVVSP